MKAKIFVCHTPGRENVQPKVPYFAHILGGAALYDKEVPKDMLGDNSGDNISKKNKSYCELTVQYWAWKNVDADYYGFCHYRRYFCFNQPEGQMPDIYANVPFDFFDDTVMPQILSEQDDIIKKMKGSPIALATLFDVRNVDAPTVYDHYKLTPYLHSKDMDILLEVIHDISPEFDDAAKEHINSYFLYPCNMFIMKRELFYRYCGWLFPILEECEKRIDTSIYNEEELRCIGHLAGCCLGIFYIYLNQSENVNAVFFQRLLIQHPDVGIKPKPLFENQVTIVTAANNYYVPYMAVMIQSLLENISSDNKYELCIMHTDITEENTKKIKALSKKYLNVGVTFYNMVRDIASFPFKGSGWANQTSNETFYRTLVHTVFCNYEKILYLDSDIIIKADIAGLFNIDISDNLIGACLDGDFIGMYCSIPDAKEYADKVLKISSPLKYFNAGVTLVNINQFRKTFSDRTLADKAVSSNYRWQDQDLLNVSCHTRTHFFDLKWNVMVQHKWDRVAIIRKCPFSIYSQYLESRKAPKIIHYAGAQKPWSDPAMDFAEDFWEVAKRSPFYEILLNRMAMQRADEKLDATNSVTVDSVNQIINEISLKKLLKRAVKNRLKRCVNFFLPAGTGRRKFTRKVWMFLKRQ